MKKRRAIALFMAAVVAASAVGCGSGSDKAKTDEDDSNTKESAVELSDAAKNHADDGEEIIGISMPAEHLPRWIEDGKNLQKYFEDAGYKVDIRWADNTIDVQQDDIHTLINDGVDILLIAAVDGTKLSDVLEEAKAAEMPVIAYDRIIESDSVDYYVSFDNDMVGQLQGEYIRDTLNLDKAKDGQYNMEIVSGDSNDKNADGYYNGAMGILQKYIDDGKVVVQSGETGYYETETFQWSTEKAEERMSGILSSYYADKKLDAVLVANDTAAIGVANAIGKNYSGKNDVIVTGQDGDDDNIKNIVDGKQSMTVYKCLPRETKVMFDVTVAFMKGEEIDDTLINKSKWDFEVAYAPERYSNGTDYMKSFLLTPVTITKDNIQKELIDSGFYEIGEDGYPVHVKADTN